MDDIQAAPSDVPKKKWPLYLAVGFLGTAMLLWSVVLPVLGVIYLWQMFS